MGKKATMSRAYLAKTAKKQQAVLSCSSSLTMKALRPRVYITDVANFKQLVQELTGNSNIPSPQPIPDNAHVPCPPQLSHDTITATTVVENIDNVLRSGETSIWDDFGGVQQHQTENDALLTFGDVEGWLLDVDSPTSWESFITSEAGPYDFIAGGIF